jgi:intracellular septation protein A
VSGKGTRFWLYQRPFAVGTQQCMVLLEARLDGLASSLWIDGEQKVEDYTPGAGVEALRNHRLAATLADGRSLEVEAGYINWWNVGIAARIDGTLMHESHPGRRIAYPARLARMVGQSTPDGHAAMDMDKLRRNRIPIAVDIATGLLFFILAKLTNLQTAALVGAGVGLALLAAQKITKVDLLGGLAMFGIIMLMVSAGFAVVFEDDELIKQRSTIVGLIGAACFLGDGLLLRGGRLGRGMSRYIAYRDLDERRLSLGMGLTGIAMAAANFTVVRLASTDVWLFYTTFGDIPLSMALVLFAIRWARSGGGSTRVAA